MEKSELDYSFNQVKLVIWDLDETFWKGTLSEGQVSPIQEHIYFVRQLADDGILCSICSKNDRQQVMDILQNWGIDGFFIFNSIDWTAKGARISQLIKDIGLRPENCLFIDDNKFNLNEASYVEPKLMTTGPEIVPNFVKWLKDKPSSDLEHQRLKYYKLLDRKNVARTIFPDNITFLYDSDIRVEFHYDCLNHIDRIHELVSRTNQLNYTKNRSSREELEILCKSSDIKKGYITVTDHYGDYGIVGFFAVKECKFIHFLFSCRILGQGVEQYVYAQLGYPQLEIKGEVAIKVTFEKAPDWINQKRLHEIVPMEKKHLKVVLKGPCDLKAMSEYLQSDSIIKEFTYHTNDGKIIEHHNHSINYLQWHQLKEIEKKELLDECIFNDLDMYPTSMFDDDVAILFLSTLIEPTLGVYRRKKDGVRIAYGEYIHPLTDPDSWEKFITKEYRTNSNDYTRDWLEQFSNQYEFEGRLTPEQIVEQAKTLLKVLPSSTKVCYMLGSEMPNLKNSELLFKDRHIVHKAINDCFRLLARQNDRILLIDVNDFLHEQKDFMNNINHYSRFVYYQMAKKANEYIYQQTGNRIIQKSKLYVWIYCLIDRIERTGFFHTPLWNVIRVPYKAVRHIL